MAKRGRPRKDDPRHLARKAEELARQQRLERVASGLSEKGLPDGVNKTDTGNYQARITINGTRYNLGSFKTPEEAGEHYKVAKRNGVTCCRSPKKNSVKRGTGPRVLLA